MLIASQSSVETIEIVTSFLPHVHTQECQLDPSVLPKKTNQVEDFKAQGICIYSKES